MHDVCLACHGLDSKDNEFVIGIIGKELHPLSHVVQSMRKTRQLRRSRAAPDGERKSFEGGLRSVVGAGAFAHAAKPA